jgi:hypothetical protein
MTRRESINQSRRRHGGRYLHSEKKALETIIDISTRHGISPEELLNAFIHALEPREEVACRKLTIKCRREMKDRTIFLITSNSEVVAQFSIPKYVLSARARREKTEPT